MEKMNDISVSVIIPMYNVEKYIEKCASSLLKQTLKDIEYIFVDDCSTDGTVSRLEQVIQNYSARIHQVRILKNASNMGSAATRNAGLAQANGMYIGWVDADDWIENSMYVTLYNLAIKTKADIVWCNYSLEYEEKSVAISTFIESKNKSVFLQKYLICPMTPLWNTLIKKDLYFNNKIIFLDGCDMWEDYNVTAKLYYFSQKSVHSDIILYHYRQTNTNSMCKSGSNYKKNMAKLKNASDVLDFFSNKDMFPYVRKQLYHRILSAKQFFLYIEKDIQSYISVYPQSNYYILSNSFYGLKAKGIEWLSVKLYLLIIRLSNISI